MEPSRLPAPPAGPGFRLSRGWIIALVVLAFWAYVAISNAAQEDSGGGGSVDTVSEWAEFPAGLQPSIDAYAAEGDCAGLQATFDSVDASDGAHPDILTYIDGKMSAAGCYG